MFIPGELEAEAFPGAVGISEHPLEPADPETDRHPPKVQNTQAAQTKGPTHPMPVDMAVATLPTKRNPLRILSIWDRLFKPRTTT